MAELNLSKYGISGTTEIVHNPSYEMLFAEETKPGLEGYEVGQVSELAIDCRKEFFDDAHFAGHALAPLFVDDAALLVDFLGVESEGACPVMEEDRKSVV